MIIADENLHQQFIDRLSADGYDIFLIREHLSGVSDYEVAAFAKYKQGLIITEDKDFGELGLANRTWANSTLANRDPSPESHNNVVNVCRANQEPSAYMYGFLCAHVNEQMWRRAICLYKGTFTPAGHLKT